MAKKPKANLAEFDMDFDFSDDTTEVPTAQTSDEQPLGDDLDLTDDDLPKRIVGIYLKVEWHERQELREWCVRHNKTMKDLLFAGYDALLKKEGP